jgi:hypothetical protein
MEGADDKSFKVTMKSIDKYENEVRMFLACEKEFTSFGCLDNRIRSIFGLKLREESGPLDLKWTDEDGDKGSPINSLSRISGLFCVFALGLADSKAVAKCIFDPCQFCRYPTLFVGGRS